MPGKISCESTDVRIRSIRRVHTCASVFALSGFFIAFDGLTRSAFAQADPSAATSEISQRLLHSLESTHILMLAVFAGAMSFALLSAFWLIRERNRAIAENVVLRSELSGLRARNDRNDALIYTPEQCILVWNGSDETPEMIGRLPTDVGMPEDIERVLAFGGWIHPDAAAKFEQALNELRSEALAFDLSITTRTSAVLDAQGRTSGSHAFIRFRELGRQQAEHAKLKDDHDEVLSVFQSIQKLFEVIPMPVWLKRNDGTLFWANQAYAKAVEVEEAREVVNRNLELFDYEQREEIAQSQQENGSFVGTRPAVVSGDRTSMEIFTVKTDTGSAGIAADQREVAEMAATLKETNDSHAKMLDQLATAVAIFDKSQRLTFHNSSFRQLWKLDEAFLESEPTNGELLDAMRDMKLLPEHPDWRKWREAQLQIYTATEPLEEWWHLLNGQTIRVVANPRNQGGASWFFENVTEQLALESNYNSLIRTQGETLDHLNDAVAVFGSDGKLKLFNPSLEKLWGSAGLTVVEGLHIAKVIELWTETLANGVDLESILGKITGFDDDRANLEGRLKLGDGGTLSYMLVPLPEGRTMLTLANITASVNFEKALQERAEALEESDLLKSKFIQHVSYELRAPLTTIAGFGEMLEATSVGPINEKQAQYLSHINESASVLRALVDDILDLASIDAGTMTLDQQMVSFTDIVDEVFADLANRATEHEIALKMEIESGAEAMFADPERLAQVLYNLVANAISYSPDCGKVLVQARREGNEHLFSVTDEGPGVPKELRESIFGRFESNPVAGRRTGTGLGLSVAYSFMHLHGGSVRVEEVEEGGARFVCRLPLELPSRATNDEGAAVA